MVGELHTDLNLTQDYILTRPSLRNSRHISKRSFNQSNLLNQTMRSNDLNSEGCQVIDDFDSVCSDAPNYLNDIDKRKLHYANQI